MRNKLLLRGALLLTVLLVLSGCGGADEAASIWDEIQESGVLVVGTSADYPPWEYIDEEGEFAGFDMDMVRLIGEHHGLDVEITDISFEVLVASVKEGKIHLAAACMSDTPERAEQVDFSDPYWTIVSSPVVATDSDFQIDDIEDILSLRVGVQTGTTDELWLSDNVEEGKMDDDNLFRYERNDQAIMDLVAGRLDAVLLEAIVGNSFSRTMDIQVVSSAYIEWPSIALALPKGEDEFMSAINEAIKELQDSGALDQLAEKHFTE